MHMRFTPLIGRCWLIIGDLLLAVLIGWPLAIFVGIIILLISLWF